LDTATPCTIEPRTRTATGTEPYVPAVNPSTGYPTKPDLCQWGPYELPASDCAPLWDPTPEPTATPTPLPTGTAVPQPPVDPDDADDANRCWPKGWGAFNPLEWVYKPVLCALKDAFVPPPGTLGAGIDGVRGAWNDTAPVAAANIAKAIFTPFLGLGSGDTSDCRGWAMRFTIPGVNGGNEIGPWYPFQACSEPTITLSHLAVGLESVGLYAGGIMLCLRMVSSAFGVETPFEAGTVAEPGPGVGRSGWRRYARAQTR
jgi:hypothetical protein